MALKHGTGFVRKMFLGVVLVPAARPHLRYVSALSVAVFHVEHPGSALQVLSRRPDGGLSHERPAVRFPDDLLVENLCEDAGYFSARGGRLLEAGRS